MRGAVRWLVFFLISLGLGYPTLNRYDPRHTGGLSDTETYYQLAVDGPAHADPQLRDRVLVPVLARAVASVARGRVGTWEPVFFGFLVVNAFFTATTAWLIADLGRVLLGGEAIGGEGVGLIGAALYLLNFETANILLSGMTDAADGCFLMAIVWSLVRRRVWPLPLWGLLGATAKETFVPLALVFTAVWWFISRREKRWKPGETGAVLGTGVAALISITVVQSVIAGHVVWPWEFAAQLHETGGHMDALLGNTVDRNVLFMAAWLLPMGLPRLRLLPAPWIAASGAAALTALALAVWHSSSAGAAARPFFTVVGPLLSLSAAAYFADTKRTDTKHTDTKPGGWKAAS
jgi:hypothetical protein